MSWTNVWLENIIKFHEKPNPKNWRNHLDTLGKFIRKFFNYFRGTHWLNAMYVCTRSPWDSKNHIESKSEEKSSSQVYERHFWIVSDTYITWDFKINGILSFLKLINNLKLYMKVTWDLISLVMFAFTGIFLWYKWTWNKKCQKKNSYSNF